MSNRRVQLATPDTDRRASYRLPIEREVRYKIVGGRKTAERIGSGRTLNMSSRGVLFTTESSLPKGASLEIAISWPVELDDAIPLKFVAVGVLVRANEQQAAISFRSYEFKIRGTSL